MPKHNKHTEGGGGGWRGEPVPSRWQLSLGRGLSPPGARALARLSAPPSRPAGRSSGAAPLPQPRAGIPPGRAGPGSAARGGSGGGRAAAARGAGPGCARGEAPGSAAAALAPLPEGYF